MIHDVLSHRLHLGYLLGGVLLLAACQQGDRATPSTGDPAKSSATGTSAAPVAHAAALDYTPPPDSAIPNDQLGASIGPVLRAQSDLLRTKRFQNAEKAGAAATQKLLFPLVLCIMPAVFIVIFGPIFLNFVYGTGVVGD